MTQSNGRAADHAIDALFLQRWSPRAFTAEEISETELARLLEAARWAPSASNVQPWRFIYARRGTAHWARLLGLLNPNNQLWADKAAALVFVASHTLVQRGEAAPVPSRLHAFDAGAAWGFLALQASLAGWHAHGIGGFDAQRAPAELGVPEDFHLNIAIAIGRQGPSSALPEPLQAREIPSQRRPLSAIAFEGAFPSSTI